MTQIEQLIKTILPDFLAYLEVLEKEKNIEKELDIVEEPSIHSNVTKQKGV